MRVYVVVVELLALVRRTVYSACAGDFLGRRLVAHIHINFYLLFSGERARASEINNNGK